MKRKLLRIVSFFTAVILFCITAETAGFTAETEDWEYVETTTGTVRSTYFGDQYVIESYLTNKENSTSEVKPCDIIFVLDQSKWMNTEYDNGEERETIINSINTMLQNMAEPTTEGEHRVAIVGYGRVNVGINNAEVYNSSVYPGAHLKSSSMSLNTGYYSNDGSFVTTNGWTEIKNVTSEELPTMPECYRNAMSYDSTFMSIEDAEQVLDPDVMQAWYAGASRMDAGLSITKQLADIVSQHNEESGEDRNLIICMVASSLPIQNNATTGSSYIRENAVTALGEKLKNQYGATIFAFGDYHNSGKTDIVDTENGFNSVMTSICGNSETSDEEKAQCFFPLSGSNNITEALNKMITKVTLEAVDEKEVSHTVVEDTFTRRKKDPITWAEIKEKYPTETFNKMNASAEFYRFTGYYEDGTPDFEYMPYYQVDLPLSLIAEGDEVNYSTLITPLPSFEDWSENHTTYGTKVVITIADPIRVDYVWASESPYPDDVELPSEQYLVLGDTHSIPDMRSDDPHYQFEGWFTDDQCESPVYGNEVTPIQNMTFYGLWSKRVVVSYDWTPEYSLGDEPDASERIEVGGIPDLFYPEMEGYEFGGWYSDPELTQPYDVPEPCYNDMTLYALWIPKVDTVGDETDVSVEKTVLLNPKTNLNDSSQSIEQADKLYEVNNDGLYEFNERKSVLAGDRLTYRVKISNGGEFETQSVNIYDYVPDGTTLVEGSLKIYRQSRTEQDGEYVYGKPQEVDPNSESGYVATVKNDGSLMWVIPSAQLNTDYYVEFSVTVDALEANAEKGLLLNRASYDFTSLSGDIKSDYDSSGLNNAVFIMSMTDQTSANGTQYTVNFTPNVETADYKNIKLEFVLPYSVENGAVGLVDENGNELECDVQFSDYDEETESTKITVTNFKAEYGRQYQLNLNCGEALSEGEIKATASYEVTVYDKETGESKVLTRSDTITRFSGVTNQVRTDVTHLYICIKKQITTADPSQTFLFRIERFENENSEQPSETFYTTLSCSQATEGKLVQADKRGWYKITEIDSWSDTDYDFMCAYADDATVSGLTGASVGGKAVSQSEKSVSFQLPREQYQSGAFPTILGTPTSKIYPSASFANSQSIYAFLSAQPYVENFISKQKNGRLHKVTVRILLV